MAKAVRKTNVNSGEAAGAASPDLQAKPKAGQPKKILWGRIAAATAFIAAVAIAGYRSVLEYNAANDIGDSQRGVAKKLIGDAALKGIESLAVKGIELKGAKAESIDQGFIRGRVLGDPETYSVDDDTAKFFGIKGNQVTINRNIINAEIDLFSTAANDGAREAFDFAKRLSSKVGPGMAKKIMGDAFSAVEKGESAPKKVIADNRLNSSMAPN